MPRRDRIRGGLYGLLVGDALGVPYEFHPAAQIPAPELVEMSPPPWFARAHGSVPPGTWSDDGAQALVLLESLLRRGRLDLDDLARGLLRWWDEGWCAVDGRVFDVGIQTSTALRRYQGGIPADQSGPADEHANGNGSLMRVLPLALWHTGTDAQLVADAAAQSRVTHGHLRAIVCCQLYCLWARRLADGMPPTPAWQQARQVFDQLHPDGTPGHAEVPGLVLPDGAAYEIQGSGYVVHSLRAAVSLLTGPDRVDYERVVRGAIALGQDTDTTACIAGGVAGLVVGEGGIPRRWRDGLRGRALIEDLLSRWP